MMRIESVGADRRPPWWQTLPLMLACSFFGMMTSVYSPLGWQIQKQSQQTGSVLFAIIAVWIVAVGLPILLWWRHQYPVAVVLIASIVPIVVPIGIAMALVALMSLLGRRKGPRVWLVAAVSAVAIGWVMIADSLAQPRAASFLKVWLGANVVELHDPMTLAPTEVTVVILMGLGIPIGVGLLLRWRREKAVVASDTQQARTVSQRLGDEAARRQERERIAREVHDAMGHRLSLLNLHAGALEANAADDPRAAQSAQLVRESASAAMDDLRTLLGVLNDPNGGDLPPVKLNELADVVAESFGAGQSLSSSIFIADADKADPVLARAVYRIVQELLTNARKHAPSEQVWLSVSGGPAEGITIDCSNKYLGGWGTRGPGDTRGLSGISERAELLGGTVQYGVINNGEQFRVHVELPWKVPTDKA